MSNSCGTLRLALCAGALVAIAGSAQAGIGGVALTIEATNASGIGTPYQVFEEMGTWSSDHTVWEWTSGVEGYDIYDDQFNEIAHVGFMHCKMVADPQITVDFNVTATASLTSFHITTGLLTLPSSISSGAQGRASASVTITDNDSDGATLTGLFGTGNAYRANLNGSIPFGTTFANLIPGAVVADPDSSNGANGDYPLVGYAPIAGAVNSLQAKYSFSVSPNDSASGESFFEVIPGPAGMMAFGTAGLLALRRRRAS